MPLSQNPVYLDISNEEVNYASMCWEHRDFCRRQLQGGIPFAELKSGPRYYAAIRKNK